MTINHYLIVDDEAPIAELLVEYFSRKNIRATHVLSPESALDAMAFSPQLVISDYHMPQMTGMALYKQARSRGYTMPFVFMTGRIFDEKLQVEAKELGISLADIVQKPFRLSDFDAKIQDALARDAYRIETMRPNGSS